MALEVLYLVRHGKAEVSHPAGDRHRPLSNEGRRRIESMLPSALRMKFSAFLALSSPFLRAVQTRDLFAAVLTPSRNETSAVFAPSGDLADACIELTAWESAGYTRIAVFTHNPFVTALAEYLLIPGSVPDLVFHTPTILALRFDRGLQPSEGQPLWILHP